MATLLVPETYATINDAITAASNGDIISIAAGTYTETIKSQSGVTAYPLHFVGRTGNWADVIITNSSGGGSGHGMVSIASGGSISNCSLVFTQAAGGSDYCFTYGTAGGGATVTNCNLKTNTHGIKIYDTGFTLNASIVESTYKSSVTHQTHGIVTTSSAQAPKIFGSFVHDFNWANIYLYGGGDVVNCTVQTDYRLNTFLRGIYCANAYNNVWHNNTGLAIYSGIHAGSNSYNNISYGQATDYGGATPVASFDSATVATPVFVDEAANNFEIDSAGSAYQNGTYAYQTANGAPLVAIGNRTIDPSNPDIGAFQFVGGGGGGPSGKRSVGVRDKFPHLNNMKF